MKWNTRNAGLFSDILASLFVLKEYSWESSTGVEKYTITSNTAIKRIEIVQVRDIKEQIYMIDCENKLTKNKVQRALLITWNFLIVREESHTLWMLLYNCLTVSIFSETLCALFTSCTE